MPQLDILTFFGQVVTLFFCIIISFMLIVGSILPAIYKNKKAAVFVLAKNKDSSFADIKAIFKELNFIYLFSIEQKIAITQAFSNEMKNANFVGQSSKFAEDTQNLVLEDLFEKFVVYQSKNMGYSVEG